MKTEHKSGKRLIKELMSESKQRTKGMGAPYFIFQSVNCFVIVPHSNPKGRRNNCFHKKDTQTTFLLFTQNEQNTEQNNTW